MQSWYNADVLAHLSAVGKAGLLLLGGRLPLCCPLLLLVHELVKLALQPLPLSLQALALQGGFGAVECPD